MKGEESRSVTILLKKARGGNPDAEAQLFDVVYHEIKSIAATLMKNERASHTLGATGVLHEAYARLFGDGLPDVSDRQHLMRLATRAMKHVLVDHARRKNAEFRGGDRQREALDYALDAINETTGLEARQLHEAIEHLKATHARAAEVVQLRFFGNHTIAEIAEILGVSTSTVSNDWVIARARLQMLLKEAD